MTPWYEVEMLPNSHLANFMTKNIILGPLQSSANDILQDMDMDVDFMLSEHSLHKKMF